MAARTSGSIEADELDSADVEKDEKDRAALCREELGNARAARKFMLLSTPGGKEGSFLGVLG